MRLAGIRHGYGRTGEILAGVDLAVLAGRPAVVVGANGSGKSTLLRVAAGCLLPRAGAVRGRPTTTGYLPAPFPATPRLSVRRYLAHLDAVHGLPPDAARPLLDALLFSGDLDRPVSELSTGNVAKVGLAQALAAGSGIAVLDEPWTALDDPAADALADLLAERVASTAMLIADHTGRATALPGAVTHRLDGGRLTRAGAPDATVPIPRWTHIELACREPAATVAGRLPGHVVTESTGSVLRARVATDESDAWLAAALAVGCSVLSVRRSEGWAG